MDSAYGSVSGYFSKGLGLSPPATVTAPATNCSKAVPN